MRQDVGPALGSVKHSCDVVYNSAHDPNPADYNDSTWLDSFFSIDGRQIVALGHMEYHGWEHPGECNSQNYTPACWYNADTFHLSNDGGYHYKSFPAPANYMVGLPFKYVVNDGPRIQRRHQHRAVRRLVLRDGHRLELASELYRPARTQVFGAFGASPIRTSNLLDATSWRAWNGTDFSVRSSIRI